MEDIAKASDAPKWFQIYLTTDDGFSRGVLERARAAGFKAIVLTVDAIGQGSSDEYQRLGKPRPWLPYGNFPDGKQPPFKTNLSWDDVAVIRKVTNLPVVVKGITRPEDARAAIAAGAALRAARGRTADAITRTYRARNHRNGTISHAYEHNATPRTLRRSRYERAVARDIAPVRL
jgi:isopentenyl diphosphate isomerase/L-lactate dehydrogenase-like FMN-dependent dehydrogenase